MIKSILAGLEELRAEWGCSGSNTRYNSYKLLGYDVMLDSHLQPHLLEVNSRPSIYTEVLDMAVNAPMVLEMFRVVGFHLPPSIALSDTRQELCAHYGLPPAKVDTSTFTEELYTRNLSKKDLEKQWRYNKVTMREEWVEGLLDEHFQPADVRCLIKAEEEVAACQDFERIFPSTLSYTYFQFFNQVSYYDKLLDAAEHLVVAQGRSFLNQEGENCNRCDPEGSGQRQQEIKGSPG